MRWHIALLALTVAGACNARKGDATASHGDAGGKDAAREAPPLTLRLQALQSTYHLRDGAKVKQQIEDAERAQEIRLPGGARPAPVAYPNAPAVDLLLTVTNVSKAPLEMLDNCASLWLLLHGPGAVWVAPNRLSTLKGWIDAPLLLEPGQTHTVRFTQLASGCHEQVGLAYWTSPGDYRLTVVWNTATRPKDKNAGKNPDDDFLRMFERRDWTPLPLSSNAVTVTVTSP